MVNHMEIRVLVPNGTIGAGYKDLSGRNLSPSTISRMRRLRWLNRRTGRSEARNLRDAIS